MPNTKLNSISSRPVTVPVELQKTDYLPTSSIPKPADTEKLNQVSSAPIKVRPELRRTDYDTFKKGAA